jgi:CRP-like cAMP-binding protein
MGTSLLQNIYLFKEFTPQELEALAQAVKSETYTAGSEVFSEKDTADAMYVIKFGSVKIARMGKADEINVATLGTGGHFGEMAFLDGEPRSATVTVVENSEILRIGYDSLGQIFAKQPTMAVKFYKALATFLCGRLRVTTMDLSFAREKNIRHF